MSLRLVMWFLVGVLMPAAARGEVAFPYTAYVVADDAYVRSGPGSQYYPTEQLPFGTPVEVYRHDPGGWYAVRPTAEAFSWVSSRYVKVETDTQGVIVADRVVARVGSAFSDVRDVIQIYLDRGETIELLGAKQFGSGDAAQIWYRIAPPAGEFRWIAGQHVSREPPPGAKPLAASRSNRLIERETAPPAPLNPPTRVATAPIEQRRAPLDEATTIEPEQMVASEPSHRRAATGPVIRPIEREAKPRVQESVEEADAARSPPPTADRWTARSPSRARPIEPEMTDEPSNFVESTTPRASTAGRASPRRAAPAADDEPTANDEPEPYLTGRYREQEADLSRREAEPAGDVRLLKYEEPIRRDRPTGRDALPPRAEPRPRTTPRMQDDEPRDAIEAEPDRAIAAERAPQPTPRPTRLEEQDQTLDLLHSELTRLVTEAPTEWQFDRMYDEAAAIYDDAESAVVQGKARLLLAQIERFENIRDRKSELDSTDDPSSRRSAGPASPTVAPAPREPAPERLAPAARESAPASASAERESVAAADGGADFDLSAYESRYDGVGRLVALERPQAGQPRYALVGSAGEVRVYLTPAPGVNLRRFEGDLVGVIGSLGTSADQRTQHVIARRVEPLGPDRFRR